jgi:L-rhamnose mutarotase
MTMPERFAFRMNLNPGQAAEYERRHDEIFPEMVEALKDAGISDYEIWLDPETHHLFGVLTRRDDHTMNRLPDLAIVRRWWKHMADVMETGAENVPTQVPLKRVFLLP